MSRLIFVFVTLLITMAAHAMPKDALLSKVSKHVVKINVVLDSGRYGSGSGVVVAKDRIVTNCHVVAHAASVSIVANGTTYQASAVTPDWYHDICLLTVENLNEPITKLGSSKQLQYETPVFAVGYPKLSPALERTSGYVKGLFPMDDSVVIRTSSTFQRGESGGGLFDEDGQLVGIITLKSPGRGAYYYNMPVEWVTALLEKPAQEIHTKSEPAFWAVKPQQWPYFMKVVHPYQTKDWKNLYSIAQTWTHQEPGNIEAWFYLATAEYAKHDNRNAEAHLRKVMTMNADHSQAIYYLALVAEKAGRHTEALSNVALLTKLDVDVATKLKVALKALH